MEAKEKKQDYTKKLIELISKRSGLDLSKYDMNELIVGMLVELEHGSKNEKTNVTDDDPEKTLKIAMAHLDEISDYYTRLTKMEDDAKKVNTNQKEIEDNKEDEEKKESEDERTITELTSRRFKELCGLTENYNKKQLKNESYQDKKNKKEVKLLSEELNLDDFEVIKFKTDDMGKKVSAQEKGLYKMNNPKNERRSDLEGS